MLLRVLSLLPCLVLELLLTSRSAVLLRRSLLGAEEGSLPLRSTRDLRVVG